MSIRKRLFLSNFIMVVMPIVSIIVFVILLNVLFGGFAHPWNPGNDGRWWGSTEQDDGQFDQLIKLSSTDPLRLDDERFMKSFESGLQGGLIVRKNDRLVYQTEKLEKLDPKNLPSYGKEGFDPVVWMDHDQFSVRQHDFYFPDGGKGSIFLLSEPGSFTQFARTFFPLLFIGLLLIVFLTNLLLSYIVSKSILRPVDRLSAAADRISSGDLDFNIRSSGKDELSKLINSFDEMREKLRKANELRERYETNRKELIANISHDLKTPITSIKGYVEGIKDGVANTEEKLNRYLDTIQLKAEHLNHLIEELFLFSKLDLNRFPFHFELVDLEAFLEDYIEETRMEYPLEEVQIGLEVEAEETEVSIDRAQIKRVLDNIIRNSIKYSDKNQCRISIRLIGAGDGLHVRISDNGPGIAQDDLQKIFNQFYRGDPSRGTDEGGSGLGLAIASQIIEAHGGVIWADSTSGEGLTVSFTLK